MCFKKRFGKKSIGLRNETQESVQSMLERIDYRIPEEIDLLFQRITTKEDLFRVVNKIWDYLDSARKEILLNIEIPLTTEDRRALWKATTSYKWMRRVDPQDFDLLVDLIFVWPTGPIHEEALTRLREISWRKKKIHTPSLEVLWREAPERRDEIFHRLFSSRQLDINLVRRIYLVTEDPRALDLWIEKCTTAPELARILEVKPLPPKLYEKLKPKLKEILT